ncbi:Chloramphenicol acetyltransferase-like domain protein, partial [Metarhizium majus ARSEF 297]
MPTSPCQPAVANGVGMAPPHNNHEDDYSISRPPLASMGRQSTFVRPRVPLIPGWMKLTPLDQVESRFILPLVLVFNMSSPALGRGPLLRDLETSLANTIGEMAFLAANVVPECEEQGTIQLEISDDDAGVWFHSQELPEMDYHALERREFPPGEFPLLALMPEPRVHDAEQKSPVLTVLATFIAGGLLLTLNSHHSVMDGAGMLTLAMTLAKHMAALSDGRLIAPEDSFPEEALDRSNVFGCGGKEVGDFPNYRTSQTYRCAVERELVEAAVSGRQHHHHHHHQHPRLPLLQKLNLSHWFISAESMRAMRDAALPPPPPPPSEGLPLLTDNTILCAVLWRHISRARRLSCRGIVSSSLVNTVNVRRRLDPPLPLEYPGNAVVHAKTSAATADVESTEPGMLYKMAKQITDAIEWWTSERVWELVGAIESSAVVNKVEPNMDNFQGPDLEVTSTAAMGDIYRAEWGSGLGRIRALRYAYLPIKDGWVNVLPQRTDAGLELLVCLEKSTLRLLRRDQEWLRLARESR